jgi:hypothetical protein
MSISTVAMMKGMAAWRLARGGVMRAPYSMR